MASFMDYRAIVTAMTENNLIVVGHLTILAFDFQDIKAGCYIANQAHQPFAYKVDPETINNIPIRYSGENDE